MRFRRDLLKKMIASGGMVARTSYHYDGRAVTSANTPGNEWKPARLMGIPEVDHVAIAQSPTHSAWPKRDWKDGYWNFDTYWFNNKAGWAEKKGDNLWEMHFADTSVELKWLEVKNG